MSAWGVENLPHVLQNAIYSNDIPTIKRHLPKIQHDLDEALLLAMPHSAPFTIKFFLEAGARLGNNVFYAAFERQDTAVFEAFMETGWHIDDTPVQYSAVHLSIVSRRNESLLRWFLDRGADPDIRLRRHRNSCSTILSPMAEAARLGLTSELLMLFEFNATLDPEAMFYAIGVMRDRAHPGTATMQILLDHGADINFVSRRWSTVVRHAVRMNSMDKMKWLLANGADSLVRYLNGGQNALEYARAEGKEAYVEVLERACNKLPEGKEV